MRKAVGLILVFLIGVTTINAQGGGDSGWNSKFGGAGGFTPVWVIPDLDGLNILSKDAGLGSFSNSGMITYGGSGFMYAMFLNNLRIGGLGFGGSISETGIVNGYNKEIDYSIGFGGISIEYSLPFIRNMALSVGCIVGWGNQTIKVYQNKGSYSWGDLENDLSNPPLSSSTFNTFTHKELSNGFFTISPIMNFDFPVNRFVVLRIGAGYMIPFSDKWEVDNGNDFAGVPSSLNKNKFFIQTGVFVGFFAL